MKVQVMQPAGMVLEIQATRVRAEGPVGHFTILPRHQDTVAALRPGILEVVDDKNAEHFIAVNGGVLVKAGREVLVSTTRAVKSDELERLREAVEVDFYKVDEREKLARGAMARIEAGLVRKFLEL